MYQIVSIEDVLRIPPSYFKKPIEEAALELVKENYEGRTIPNLGIVIAVVNVKVSDVGKIIPGDGALYHKVFFDALVFTPLQNEVVEGDIETVEKYGIFVRLGPIDGFIHVSQIEEEEEFTYDRAQQALIGKKKQRIVKKGDIIRARITSVSYGTGELKTFRVHMTMRQPALGKIEWIEEETQLKKKAKTR